MNVRTRTVEISGKERSHLAKSGAAKPKERQGLVQMDGIHIVLSYHIVLQHV